MEEGGGAMVTQAADGTAWSAADSRRNEPDPQDMFYWNDLIYSNTQLSTFQ